MAGALCPGDSLMLVGDLGMGKTTLVRGLARGLGVGIMVKSPTFALHLTYPGRVPLHHLDLYRLSSLRDIHELGLDDFLGRDGVCVIEWAERLQTFPDGSIRIDFSEEDDNLRRLRFSGPQEPLMRLSESLGTPLKPLGASS
ncbi:MAG: tRNA (adenosine(37)-N6)-threonylcarbamoyltransferase complex ATPase subunit type 1 TsaE [Candidatus Eisenbacteria bacterium]|uniref:tRNA threonylcarbamoyladenosine biosynthesis protein TsaE n=1 Tax=Eiseniibacteriota bacterium TaxID=2212470 RepID=A0A7Y2E9M9_UNCEI|nr:tRNA (adenosine(37)-N6)-threonylcarbamoyltransferase complex ATPase subunit type 1 TsaE [Candidatus Eisenbacteria bacterium]